MAQDSGAYPGRRFATVRMNPTARTRKGRALSAKVNNMRRVSHTYQGSIGTIKFKLTIDLREVMYRGRWRLVQFDETGGAYVQSVGVTQYFTIELTDAFAPYEKKETA